MLTGVANELFRIHLFQIRIMNEPTDHYTATEYLDLRLDKEQTYFSQRSGINKTYHYGFKITIITLTVLIPILTGYLKEYQDVKYIVGIISVALGIVTGLDTFFKFNEKWISNRNT